jgi:hypothetical protein
LVSQGGNDMTARHLFALGAVLLLVCASCSAGPLTGLDPSYSQSTVEAVAALRDRGYPSLDFLRGLVDGTEEGFDANEYFAVLSHLSIQDGYTLGYLYYLEEDFGGHPVLHARPSQYATLAEYIEAEQPDLPSDHSYLDHIRIDGTAEGFFEFVVLRIIGEQFYLYWHSARNDAQIVCSKKALGALLDADPRLPADVKRRARALDVVPAVEMGDDAVVVKVVTFSDWGGFIQRSYTISREFPHKVLQEERETLVEYDSGVQF